MTSDGLVDVLPPLSPRQEELLIYLWRYWRHHRYSPTQREMCEALGLRTTNAAPYVDGLAAKGYVERRKGQRRNVLLTRAGLEKLELMGEDGPAQMALHLEEDSEEDSG